MKSQSDAGKLRILNSNSNLYDIIINSDLVLGVPYTSSVQIANMIGIRSAFVAIDSDEWDLMLELDGVRS